MGKWFCPILALICICIGILAGCSQTSGNEDTSPTGWQPDPSPVRDLTGLLSASEVSEAVGVTVGDGVMQEGGEILSFTSSDYSVQVSLLLEEEPVGGAQAYLKAVTDGYEEGSLISAPNLGKAAFWCEASGELLVRDDSRVFSVNLQAGAMDGERRLIAARQLAALVLERLR